MRRTGIVNIINFIRGIEPRDPHIDLYEPVERQMECVVKHCLPATWLLQYDALNDERFHRILNKRPDNHEIGAWFELVQPLVEDAGLKWRGRFPWDWHSNVDFSVGYTPKERERLADVFMEKFRRVYGTYPVSVGSWFMDAHLLGHLVDRYGITASCNCKDQWGTDGYTLWGGYYGQAYYPSRKNAFMPAQNPKEQICVPIFRMLGPDPIYQYDSVCGPNGQSVVTLEPVYKKGGGSPEWVKWFFDTMFHAPSLSFGYAQVGQENSFGWPSMEKGFTHQISVVSDLARSEEIRVETLGESGKWYRQTFDVTPPSAIVALSDWKNEGHKSLWYYTRYYRVNLFWLAQKIQIRDIHLFDQNYTERYLSGVCDSVNAIYDTLPILDGCRWGEPKNPALWEPVFLLSGERFQPMEGKEPSVEEINNNEMKVIWPLIKGGYLQINFMENSLEVSCGKGSWAIRAQWGNHQPPVATANNPIILQYTHEGYPYHIRIENCRIKKESDSFLFIPVEKSLTFKFD